MIDFPENHPWASRPATQTSIVSLLRHMQASSTMITDEEALQRLSYCTHSDSRLKHPLSKHSGANLQVEVFPLLPPGTKVTTSVSISAPSRQSWPSRGHHPVQTLHCPQAEGLLWKQYCQDACKMTAHCDSLLACLISAPTDTGIVLTPVPPKLLMTPIDSSHTSVRSCPATGHLHKDQLWHRLQDYSYLTPNLCKHVLQISLSGIN